jgi:hypothetical protein
MPRRRVGEIGFMFARHVIRRGISGWTGFGIGVATGLLLEMAGPHLAKAAGPAARSALKFLLGLADEVARSTARLREKAEEFVADTRAEVDAEREAGTDGATDESPSAEV